MRPRQEKSWCDEKVHTRGCEKGAFRLPYQEILYQVESGAAQITFNRPQALNALTRVMRHEFLDALEAAARDSSVRAVLLTGSGRAFSVGQDVQEMAEDYAQEGPQLGRLVQEEYVPMVQRLRALPKPTVALIHGPAAGGGLSLALAADLRIATDKASFFPAFVKVGLAPDTGSAFFLTRILGYSRALEVALRGRPISASEAVEWGMVVSRHSTPEEALERAKELVAELAAGPTEAYARIRWLFDQAASASLEDVLHRETETQEILGGTFDHREAVEAFITRRPPKFQGR